MEGTTLVVFTVTLFLISYAFIIAEKIHRTIVALAGAVVMVVAGVLDQYKAVENIDFNTLGLLVGMMIIVAITRETGVFEFIAISAVKAAKGKPMAILIWLSAMTATVSAFIDSVACMLLVIPITISIAQRLKINPIPIVFAEVILCNIGGAATLIGGTPNIMIGAAAGFGFNDFVRNMAPILIVIAAATLAILFLMFRKALKASEGRDLHILELNPKDEIKDKKLLMKSLVVLFITITGFVFHQALHLESATIALVGAALLFVIARPSPGHVLKSVEWPVLFFLIGLFVLVGGLKEAGVMRVLAQETIGLAGGELLPTGMVVLWISAIASAFVDNVPFMSTMIPVIQDIGEFGNIVRMDSIWWSLTLGVCLGGNGTIVGASANVVAIGMLEENGYRLTFIGFMRKAFPLMLLSAAISSVFLVILYLT